MLCCTLLCHSSVSVPEGATTTYRPRFKLFDSDPVPPGEESSPAPALPQPFASKPHMFPDTCNDASSGIAVSMVAVASEPFQGTAAAAAASLPPHDDATPSDDAPGVCAHAGDVMYALLCVQFPRGASALSAAITTGAFSEHRGSCDPAPDVGVGSLSAFTAPNTARFDLEWHCSRDVYSPYVMKALHSVKVNIEDGPYIAGMKEFDLVRRWMGTDSC